MKKINLVLVISAFCLAFVLVGQAETAAPTAPAAPSAPVAPAAPGASGTVVRPGDPGTNRSIKRPAETSTTISEDPEQRKIEADFRTATKECNLIPNKDSQTKCINDAETNYINRKP